MSHQVLVPPLGQTVDTVTLVTWYKDEGDAVQEGEPLFAIETDKATLDIEAPASGILRRVSVAEGTEVQVLSAIALIAAPGEGDLGAEALEQPALRESGTAGEAPATAQASPVSHTAETRPAKRLFVSPRARRLAEAEGVPLEGITGTGPEGAIVERDMRAFLADKARAVVAPPILAASPLPTARQPSGGLPHGEPAVESPLQGMRAVVAQHMDGSPSRMAPATLMTEADAGALVALREQLLVSGLELAYDELFLSIVGHALCDHPALNASLEANGVRQWERIHVGLAVHTDRGLVMPVVRDVDRKRLGQLSRDIADLTRRARVNQLKPEDLGGGTFALVNLGMLGIDAFTPIVHSPETAVLGVGRIKARPAVKDGAVVVQPTVWLSLTFDHRLVDTGLAARFMERVAQLFEQPHRLLA